MPTHVPSINESGVASGSKLSGGLRSLLYVAPAILILVALGGLSYWGHQTGWEFTRKLPHTEQPIALGPDASRLVVRFTPGPPGSGLLGNGQSASIEFTTAADVESEGVGITPVWHAALTEQVTGAGEVGFDPSRVARLSARAKGVSRRVLKAVGDPVRPGELLALVESADVGRSKAEFQQALVQARLREKTRDDLVAAKSATSPAHIREAEAAAKEAGVRLLAAAQALTNLGLPVKAADYRGLTPAEVMRRIRLVGLEDLPNDFPSDLLTSNLLPIRSPFAGVVFTADVVAGEAVETGRTLFVVVDSRRVWVTLHLSGEDARRVIPGQKTLFRPDGETREYPAVVAWVGTAADEHTRTVPVRAEAENPTGALRASTLGRGRIVLREEPKAVVVPNEAVHLFRGKAIVFVRHPDYLKADGPKVFNPRPVRAGGRDEQNTEVLAGVSPGEIVATKGSGVLLSELTRAAANR